MAPKNTAAQADNAEDDSTSIFDLAKASLLKTNGDWQKAAALFALEIKRNRALFDELVQPLLDEAIWNAIRQAAHVQRQGYPPAIVQDNASGLVSVGRATQRQWMDYPLSSGVKLGDADRTKLTDEAEMHSKLAKGNALKAEFFSTIAKRIDGKTVREVLSEEQIGRLWEKCS